MATACMICGTSLFRKRSTVANSPLMECRTCGLQFLDPFPDAAMLKARYDHYYDGWGIEPEGLVSDMKQATFRRYLDRIRSFVDRGALLDVGCATGELMSVARELGFDVYGAEISPDGIRRSRELFGADRIIGGHVKQGDFPADYFAVVTLSDVLEHIPDPLHFMDMLWTMLKPGGLVMIITPDTSSWTRQVTRGCWPHYKEDHLYYYNRSNLARMVSGTFDVVISEQARKTLTLDYVSGVMQSYRAKGPVRMLARFLQWLPMAWKTHACSVHIGEMFVVLKKRPH